MNDKSLLTIERLRYLLDYDPNTGLFTWVNPPNRGPAKPGSLANHRNARGYITIKIDGTSYRAHRLAWFYHYGKWPGGEIDHINHVCDDNRISNLRVTTRAHNGRNTRLHNRNTSGVCGVHFDKERQKWVASIRANNRTIQLGRYAEKEDAVKARMRASKEYGFHPNHGAITLPEGE